ncbi:MAG: protein kinase [Bacteroidales bacterium]|nr:protein kinase [Bacteroidales bacterium]
MSDLSERLKSAKKQPPQGTATAPQDTATVPQGTATAPQGTATAPQGTATAPQSTATAPQGTATPPQGDTLHCGSQADIIVRDDGKVLKIYKEGYTFNASVLPLVKQLCGKGYLIDLYDFGTMDFQGEQRCFELMQHCPKGAVSDFNLKGNKDAIMKIALKTAMALDQCHRLGFIHKDVKPANILVNNESTWDCLLCDFGIADILDHGKVQTLQSRTPIYAAPEVYDPASTVIIDNKTYCNLTPAADFYSLGMTILSLWYGESAFRAKETLMAMQKAHDGIVVPTDMPEPLFTITRGLLTRDPVHRWGLKQIQDFVKGKKVEIYDETKAKGLNIIYNSSKNQIAHTPEELAAFMVEDADLAKKFLYSGKISKWLEYCPELQVEIEKIVEEDYPDDEAMGFLAAIHTLNPFYDLNLCCDVKHPDYAMTGEAIGRLLNKVYYLYFTKNNADDDALLSDFDGAKAEKIYGPELAYNIVWSFQNGGDADYLPWFFDHKGNRFAKQRKWFGYCVTPSKDDEKKAGPKDRNYKDQVAIMKAIVGYGATPEYRLSRTGQVLKNLDDFLKAPKKELKYDLQNDKGLRGWLAVQYQENPNADFKPKYAYEKLLEQYVQALGMADTDNENFERFIEARTEAQSVSDNAKSKIKRNWARSVIQKVLAGSALLLAVFLLIVIIQSLIASPTVSTDAIKFKSAFYILGAVAAVVSFFIFDSDGCLLPIIVGGITSAVILLLIKFLGQYIVWIYGLVVLAAIVFFSIKTLFDFSPFVRDAKSVANPGFEELTLEPLYFAFNDEKHFDSSLNGVVDGKSIEYWKLDLQDRWKWVGIFIGVVLILGALSLLLPNDTPKIKGETETTIVNDSINVGELEK